MHRRKLVVLLSLVELLQVLDAIGKGLSFERFLYIEGLEDFFSKYSSCYHGEITCCHACYNLLAEARKHLCILPTEIVSQGTIPDFHAGVFNNDGAEYMICPLNARGRLSL